MLTLDKQIYQRGAWFVGSIVLILILCTFLDYGITWDEELQSQYGQAIADYYASGFKDDRFQEIFNLYLYGGLFDGLAAAIDHYTPFRVYDTRHLLNAMFGLLGLWGTWKMGRFLGGGAVGLLALSLCATTPMYYGHMFNNPKDIPFAAGMIWSLYYMSRCYVRQDAAVTLKLAVVFGFTLGVRVGGIMTFAFWLVPMGFTAMLPFLRDQTFHRLKHTAHELWKQFYSIVLPVGAISYAVMLVCWPWAQQSPLLNPLRALGEFSNFPQNVEVLLHGTTYRSTELPWYYVPLYFFIQLPELLLLSTALSFLMIPKIWRHLPSTAQKQSFALLALTASFPVLYAMLRHPALYDAVRHFLFIVPLICIFAAMGARGGILWALSRTHGQERRHRVMAILAGIAIWFFAVQIITMVRLHPYEYIFANSFAGGVHGAYGRYESDYWGSSFKEAAQSIQDLVAAEGGVPPGKIYKVAICGPWDSAMIYLPPDFEPVVANEPAEFFLSTTRWLCQNMRPGKEVIRIQRMSVPLSIVKDLRGGYEHYEGNEKTKKSNK